MTIFENIIKEKAKIISNEEYHNNKNNLSASRLKSIYENAYKYNFDKNNPDFEKKECFVVGTLAHLAILEPQKFQDSVCVFTPPMNKKKAFGKDTITYKDAHKAFEEENKNKLIVTQAQYDLVIELKNKTKNLLGFEKMCQIGKTELSFYGEINNHLVQCRPDLIVEKKDNNIIVVDLKTTGYDLKSTTIMLLSLI